MLCSANCNIYSSGPSFMTLKGTGGQKFGLWWSALKTEKSFAFHQRKWCRQINVKLRNITKQINVQLFNSLHSDLYTNCKNFTTIKVCFSLDCQLQCCCMTLHIWRLLKRVRSYTGTSEGSNLIF
jgi:hypothetical protein